MLIRGDQLNDHQRRYVLNAYIYRWTSDNPRREEVYSNAAICQRPTMPLVTDEEWLKDHAFHFTKDGKRLMANRRHAEPTFMANRA